MDDAFLMRRLQSFRDLTGDRQKILHRQRPAQVLAFHQLHHDGVAFQAIDRRDIGVIQRRQRLRFTLESRQIICVARERGRQHLDRNLAIELRIAGAINLAHSARSERAEDFVGAEFVTGSEGHRENPSSVT